MRVFTNQRYGIVSDGDSANRNYHLSVHELPSRTTDAWIANLQKMLRACGQSELAARLARADVTLQSASDNRTVRTVRRDSRVNLLESPAAHYLRSRLKRVALPALWRIESRVGHFLPYKWSIMRTRQSSLIVQRTLRTVRSWNAAHASPAKIR